MDLITDKKSLSLQFFCNLGGFPPGGGTEIQNFLSRPYIQKSNGGHSTGLLQIVQTCIVIRMQTGAQTRRQIIAIVCPGNRLCAVGDRQILGFQGIDPYTGITGQVIGVKEALRLSAQKPCHSFCKFDR